MESTESVDIFANLPPEERAALEKIQSRNTRLQYVYQNHIQELAEDGAPPSNGFWINIAEDYKSIGGDPKYFNPITQRDEQIPKARLWKRHPFRYQGQMTTEEFNQYATFRGKMLKESDSEIAEDMATRLYEYGAMKFLDINHDVYVRANKDEIRMAVDACFAISSWNGQIKSKEDGNEKKAPTAVIEGEFMTPSKLNKPRRKTIDQKTFDDVGPDK